MAAKDFLVNTDTPMDKIAGYYSGSLAIAAFDIASPSIPHGLGYTPLYTVKWSTTPTFSTSYDELGTSVINNLSFTAQTDGTNLYIIANNNTASSVTLYYRVLYFMPPDVNLDAGPTQLGLDSFNINTDYNYGKLLVDSVTTSGTATVIHNLGYYPQVEVWYVRSTDGRCVHVVGNILYSLEEPRAQITTSSLVFTPGTIVVASRFYYKIYADEV